MSWRRRPTFFLASSGRRTHHSLLAHDALCAETIPCPPPPRAASATPDSRASGSGGWSSSTGLVTFEVKGGVDRGRKFLNALKMISHSANLGDTRTIATHPASTTHSKLSDAERAAVGITPGLIRVSVGLEAIEDIIQDIRQAIDNSGN